MGIHRISSVPSKVATPLLAGYMLNWGLHGALTLQYYDYYMTSANDKRFVKILVHTIFLIETVQTAVTTYDAFATFGSGDFSTLNNLELSGLTGAILGGVTGCIGQCYYAYRIQVLSKSWRIPVFVILISTLQLAAGFMTGILVFLQAHISQLNLLAYGSVVTWTGSSALCDVTIAGCMTYYLLHQDTCFQPTQRILKRLVVLSIETGLITATMAILTLILVTAFPVEIYFTALAVAIPKWYSNTLLVLLNSRAAISRDSNDISWHADRSIPIWFGSQVETASPSTSTSRETESSSENKDVPIVGKGNSS